MTILRLILKNEEFTSFKITRNINIVQNLGIYSNQLCVILQAMLQPDFNERASAGFLLSQQYFQNSEKIIT